MKLSELAAKVSEVSHEKTERQKTNLNGIGEIATEFHRKSGSLTKNVKRKINLLKDSSNCVIVEVAHQPNFLPYYGVWKKAVFAHCLAKILDEKGIPAVALFGFVDQDTTMSPFLSRNKIPYYSKEGYRNIGFKIKGENEWWRMWCIQSLPPTDQIEKQIDFIITTYPNHGLDKDDEDLIRLEKLLRECYLNGCTFAEANAKFFSEICNNVFNVDVVFFKYSKAQECGIFTSGFEYLLSKRKNYVDSYNETIEQRGLEIAKIPETHVPFWYHCACGGKVRLTVDNSIKDIMLDGTCPICKNNFRIEVGNDFNLNGIYKSISFEAVSRELIVPDALGTDVYIEGGGGSLSFRQVSNVIADELSFNKPLAVRWTSRDSYVSVLLHKPIFDFTRKYDIDSLERELHAMNTNNSKLSEELVGLQAQEIALKNELERHKPESNEFLGLVEQVKNINKERKKINAEMAKFTSMSSEIQGLSTSCALIPSIVDEINSVGFDGVLKCWLSDIRNNDIDTEHVLQLPVKNIGGITYKTIMNFIDFIDEYRTKNV